MPSLHPLPGLGHLRREPGAKAPPHPPPRLSAGVWSSGEGAPGPRGRLGSRGVMLFYHGTRVSPRVVLHEGLIPARVEEIIWRVKAEYRVGHEVNRLLADDVRRKLGCLHVYLDSDREVAESYAHRGSNFENLLRIEICQHLGIEFQKKPGPGFLYYVNLDRPPGETRVARVEPGQIAAWEVVTWNDDCDGEDVPGLVDLPTGDIPRRLQEKSARPLPTATDLRDAIRRDPEIKRILAAAEDDIRERRYPECMRPPPWRDCWGTP